MLLPQAAENSTWSPAEILALDPVTGGGTEADLSSKKVNPQDKQRKIVMMGIASGPGLALLRHYAAKGHTIYGCDQRAALLQVVCFGLAIFCKSIYIFFARNSPHHICQ
eukprot:SAG31_NODE_1903_length_6956_cov_3.288902_4_plen_109_part_00